MSLNKTLVLVLNKIDLVDPELSAAWKAYLQVVYVLSDFWILGKAAGGSLAIRENCLALQAKYPLMKIVFFTSFPAYNLVNRTVSKESMRHRTTHVQLFDLIFLDFDQKNIFATVRMQLQVFSLYLFDLQLFLSLSNM